MRVAVDVLGTIEGPKRAQVLQMIHALQDLGHTVTVWSSEFSLAVDAVDKYNLDCEAISKMMRFDYPEEMHFDYAIEDDHRQGYLAAKNFIWVSDIPESLIECEALVKGLK